MSMELIPLARARSAQIGCCLFRERHYWVVHAKLRPSFSHERRRQSRQSKQHPEQASTKLGTVRALGGSHIWREGSVEFEGSSSTVT